METEPQAKEITEATEETEMWVNGLAEFKPELNNFDFSEFEQKGKALKGLLEDIHSYSKKFNDEDPKNKREMRELKRLEDVSEVNEVVIDIDKLREELIEKARMILGSIYSGQLIKEHLISRGDGNFYRYRRRYTLRLADILDDIVKHKEEVVSKLGPEQQEALAYVFNFAAGIGMREGKDNGINFGRYISIKKTFPNVALTISDKRHSGRYSVDSYDFDGFEISGAGLNFMSEGEKQNVYDMVERHLLSSNKNLIIEAKKELLHKVIEEKTKLERYKSEIDSRFSKLLVFRKLKDEQEYRCH